MSEVKTVLIVDDDEDFLLQQEICLKKAGYRVRTAAGRKEAELLVEKEKIDCAVIDLMMEEVDGGFVLAHHLKAANPALPVIMVTAVTSETGLNFGTMAEGEKKWVKADVVLAKPIRYEQLIREVQRLLA
ncbi:MAG: response regulator [Chitinispirillaceae bacterium]|nr:response regulator [Chitinispirillaceae bacterium]